MPVKVKMDGLADSLFSQDGELSKLYSGIRSKINKEKLNQFPSLTAQQRLDWLVGSGAEFKVVPGESIKNLETALEYKEKGNEFFRKNNFGEAYQNYTKALQYCPVNLDNPPDPANKQYSIIWANRSAALDGAGLYAATIHDIDMALKFGYPRELWYKIYKRKGHALIKMKQYLEAREALEVSLKNIGRSDIKKEKDRDNYRMRVRKQMTVFNVTKTLYNTELNERSDSVLAAGKPEDRGLTSKLKICQDGARTKLQAEEDVLQEDVVLALDPYVAVVNVSGGRAGGKVCPHTLEKMFHPIPCRFGSEETFSSEKYRDEASESYHQYEWRILSTLSKVGLLEKGRLALRMITMIKPGDLKKVYDLVQKKKKVEEVEEGLRTPVKAFDLPVENVSGEESLLCSVLALYLTRCLSVSGYLDPASSRSNQELELFHLLYLAVLIALRYTRPIEILDVPKQKVGILDTEIVRDVCGFGIYPDIHQIQQSATGGNCDVIRWFVAKKLVLSSFRKIEKGSSIILFSGPGLSEPENKGPNDMITFRCGNELCTNSFPLKENTKEKIISCPLEDCRLKTNIWERLRLIQKLKKDFASAKEELERNEVTLARDILKDTIEEWDRIIIRPYKEVTQLEKVYVKSLLCDIGDHERNLVEGNQMGQIINMKKKPNIMPETEPAEQDTSLVKV
ncbi:SET and MYND domain-containing protein 4 [Eurytemora carolleeae]|uniref:SET and MYND domain-containing protein 4 n=1 Tax=Eurytemora carolleeae TaxID=1294199 RepID=UPI000C76940B|nr:SET and MYND domain-containing protein 4 [Eurytemora carolleeae]|eukprot:XP_023324875.1 SET and MYND domain-containing protein 4-like [Eurytemora affinis]